MARALVSGPRATEDEEAIEDAMALMGMSREQAEDWVRDDRSPDPVQLVEVLVPNVGTARLFSALARQWRLAINWDGAVRHLGLDMTAADIMAKWMRLKRDARLLADLRVMEDEALAVLGNRR